MISRLSFGGGRGLGNCFSKVASRDLLSWSCIFGSTKETSTTFWNGIFRMEPSSKICRDAKYSSVWSFEPSMTRWALSTMSNSPVLEILLSRVIETLAPRHDSRKAPMLLWLKGYVVSPISARFFRFCCPKMMEAPPGAEADSVFTTWQPARSSVCISVGCFFLVSWFVSARRKAKIDRNRSKPSRFKSLVIFSEHVQDEAGLVSPILWLKIRQVRQRLHAGAPIDVVLQGHEAQNLSTLAQKNSWKLKGLHKLCWKPWKLASANIKSRILKLYQIMLVVCPHNQHEILNITRPHGHALSYFVMLSLCQDLARCTNFILSQRSLTFCKGQIVFVERHSRERKASHWQRPRWKGSSSHLQNKQVDTGEH